MEWSEDYLEELQRKGKIRSFKVIGEKKATAEPKKKRKHKFNAVATEYAGKKFDSTKEANRYKELLMLQKAGIIGLIELQVPFELNEGGTHSMKYYADFVYRMMDTGERVVEDAKGHRTKEYKKRRRLMKKIHGITIHEI